MNSFALDSASCAVLIPPGTFVAIAQNTAGKISCQRCACLRDGGIPPRKAKMPKHIQSAVKDEPIEA